jgi:hypothetical protein
VCYTAQRGGGGSAESAWTSRQRAEEVRNQLAEDTDVYKYVWIDRVLLDEPEGEYE